jgi:hypothetical protein
MVLSTAAHVAQIVTARASRASSALLRAPFSDDA